MAWAEHACSQVFLVLVCLYFGRSGAPCTRFVHGRPPSALWGRTNHRVALMPVLLTPSTRVVGVNRDALLLSAGLARGPWADMWGSGGYEVCRVPGLRCPGSVEMYMCMSRKHRNGARSNLFRHYMVIVCGACASSLCIGLNGCTGADMVECM